MDTRTNTAPRHERTWSSQNLNGLALLGVCLTLCIAFYYQFSLGELPCPLCLLQRVGLVLIGLGLVQNVCFGIRSAHYGMILVGALTTGAIALRQVLLHITPGSGAYGSSFLGLHFYTWAAITAVLTVLFVAGMLVLRSWEHPESQKINILGKVATGIFVAIVAANLLSTLVECGFGQCDDNPTVYQWLSNH
ncbi:disulfide bond formation protein B [Burkholderia sp. MS455]|uniref:disulfide bond formation protein B n=1 Tax=Burkholderia sp. MS455 TaxID=2811788 RepID=UPI00195E323E|nr:disulfide bond formation protein B [Burkholderia sp. MS455]QRR07533.1 disulfide bond formation protein B [Burkholderia sp. MS455]